MSYNPHNIVTASPPKIIQPTNHHQLLNMTDYSLYIVWSFCLFRARLSQMKKKIFFQSNPKFNLFSSLIVKYLHRVVRTEKWIN